MLPACHGVVRPSLDRLSTVSSPLLSHPRDLCDRAGSWLAATGQQVSVTADRPSRRLARPIAIADCPGPLCHHRSLNCPSARLFTAPASRRLSPCFSGFLITIPRFHTTHRPPSLHVVCWWRRSGPPSSQASFELRGGTTSRQKALVRLALSPILLFGAILARITPQIRTYACTIAPANRQQPPPSTPTPHIPH